MLEQLIQTLLTDSYLAVSVEEARQIVGFDLEAFNLVLELGPKAIAQYKKYHPLKISIAYTNPYQTTAILKTFIHVHDPDELTEITNWLLFLGRDIKVRKVPKYAARDDLYGWVSGKGIPDVQRLLEENARSKAELEKNK